MSIAESACEAANDIASRRVETLEKAGATFKKIAAELCTIAFSDIKNYVTITKAGTILAIPLDQITPKKASKAIKKIKEQKRTFKDQDDAIVEDVKIEYELYDKLDALKYLCKLRGDEPKDKEDESQEDAQPVQVIIEVKDARVANGN